MKQMVRFVLSAAIASTWSAAPAQRDAGPPVDAKGLRAEEPDVAEIQWTPIPPVHVPFGTALRDRLASVQSRLDAAEARREAAEGEGKSPEALAALDGEIANLRSQLADVQNQIDLAQVPETHTPGAPPPAP